MALDHAEDLSDLTHLHMVVEVDEARCLGGENTRGWYAAEAAIETVRVFEQIG